jgi:hypothetical protein
MIYTTMTAAQSARSYLATRLDALVVICPVTGGFVLRVA